MLTRTHQPTIAEYRMSDDERQAAAAITKQILATFKSLDAALLTLPLFAHELPRALRTVIYRFGTDELNHALVIRDTGLDPSLIPPTPAAMSLEPESQLREFDILHLLFASLLGEIFTFDSIQHATLVSDVFPVRENAERAASSGYRTEFSLHTDDAFTDYAGAFLGLRCLRNDERVPTVLSTIQPSDLDADDQAKLRSAAYHVRPNIAHKVSTEVEPRAILFGAADAPYIRINLNMSATDDCSQPYADAYARLVKALEQNRRDVVLAGGDCLYVDNFRAVHGREPYEPRFDGTDRWYRRVYITRDLRPSRAARATPTSRIIRMENT